MKQFLTIILLFSLKISFTQDYDYALAENSKFQISNTGKLDSIVNKAQQFRGVKYKYGGTNYNGMDCSGLICTAFQSVNINLPRSSSAIAQKGEFIEADYLQVGDLMFFKGYSSNSIGHVAMVSKIIDGDVFIVHATTSRGVIEEKLANNDYFMKRWIYNKRIIN